MRVSRICRDTYSRAGRPRQPPRRPSPLRPLLGPIATLVLIVSLLAPPLAFAAWADDPGIRILSAGIYRPAAVTGGLPAGLRDQTLSGVDRVTLPTLLAATATVPAAPCRSFGLIFARAGAAAAPLTIRVRHPPLHRPDGAGGSVDIFEIPAGTGLRFVGFTFTEAWEMVAGEWEFTLLAGDRELARQRFTVLPATTATGCGAMVSDASPPVHIPARPAG